MTTRARHAVTAVFFVNGALFANWVARVPAVKDSVGGGTRALGLALFGLGAGSLVTLPLAGRICRLVGSRRAVTLSGLANAVALLGPALAPNPVVLGVALAAYGGAFGLLDVAMNVQAVAVVRRMGRPLMPWFHAGFSLGGVTGAATGALFAALSVDPPLHFAVVGGVGVVVVLLLRPHLLDDDIPPPSPAGEPGFARRGRPLRLLLGLGAIAACAAIGEGAMADWTALFLRDVRGAEAGLAALGYGAFAVTMTVGRLGGERAIRRAGPVRVLQIGGLAAAAGVVLAVLVDSPFAGLVGFGLVGLGLSCAFPLALTTAGESSDGSGSDEIATVAVVGYLGFLLGPPCVGLLADTVGLGSALLAVAAPMLILAALARLVGVADPRAPRSHVEPALPAADTVPTHG